MKITRIALLALLAVVLVAGAAAAQSTASRLAKLNFIDSVVVAADGCGLDFGVNNRAGLDDAKSSVKGDEISVTFPRTYIHPANQRFKTLDSKCFKSAVVAQIDPHTVRAKLRFRKEFQGSRASTVSATGNGLSLRLNAWVPVPPAEPVAENSEPADIPEEAKVDLAAIFAQPEPLADTAGPEPVVAAADPVADTLLDRHEFGVSGAVVKMIVALCISLAALLALAALAKRFKLPTRLQGGRTGAIRVVQTGMIDMKRRIAVVDVAGELIVVALSGGGVTMLTKIESDEARRRLLGETASPQTEPEETVFTGPEPIEPQSFGHEKIETAASTRNERDSAAAFSAKLRAYTRHAPKESAAAGHDTLQGIAERVKGLKRL
jgi:flagellar biogenesis protein FliO